MTSEYEFLKAMDEQLFSGDSLFSRDLELVREKYVSAGAMIATRLRELEEEDNN